MLYSVRSTQKDFELATLSYLPVSLVGYQALTTHQAKHLIAELAVRDLTEMPKCLENLTLKLEAQVT